MTNMVVSGKSPVDCDSFFAVHGRLSDMVLIA
jgi:hypothetical protein